MADPVEPEGRLSAHQIDDARATLAGPNGARYAWITHMLMAEVDALRSTIEDLTAERDGLLELTEKMVDNAEAIERADTPKLQAAQRVAEVYSDPNPHLRIGDVLTACAALAAAFTEEPEGPKPTCATCQGSGCACHPFGAAHPAGLIGWSPCGECGGAGRSSTTADRIANPFVDFEETP